MKSPDELRKYRRGMKRNPTKSERVVRDRLKENGIEYKTQIIVGFYIVDFILSERMLCIEIDGDSHKGREKYDAKRDHFLEECGFKVIHIRNEDAFSYDFSILIENPILGEKPFRSALAKANNLRGQAMRPRSKPKGTPKKSKKRKKSPRDKNISKVPTFKVVNVKPKYKSSFIDPHLRKVYDKQRDEIEANRRRIERKGCG